LYSLGRNLLITSSKTTTTKQHLQVLCETRVLKGRRSVIVTGGIIQHTWMNEWMDEWMNAWMDKWMGKNAWIK